ncbi:uncharacterized protein LOC103492217 isoform X1 [Cucumis melo]|uniref:Uncharacterized protein LOC103492217 isoform X1 n=1 Tax=Cucumis melo TaxID=3656 RepID=A0A1S3BQI6_CUCME|nr:uncharacterized protein LOC103492217 isoform X1 [Cucumis melo]
MIFESLRRRFYIQLLEFPNHSRIIHSCECEVENFLQFLTIYSPSREIALNRNFSMQYAVLRYRPCFRAAGIWNCSSEVGLRRRQVLEQIDKELAKGDDRAALFLLKESQGKLDGVRCFGAARQIPQRLYTLEELKLNGIETSSLLSPLDSTLGSIERYIQLAAGLLAVSAWNLFEFTTQQIFYLSLGFLFLWTLDSVALNGGVGSLVLDTIGHTFSKKYHNRVIQHEAGHFLIAYLLGVLPKGYTTSSFEAFQKEGSLNLQAGTAFVDFEFLEEVNAGKVSATMLNRFSCIALAGVATEYLLYGCAEGGLADINKLDVLLKGLGFTQKKADSQVRWAVLNTVLILRRHESARTKLADAMSSGKSVGNCIDVIENSIHLPDL